MPGLNTAAIAWALQIPSAPNLRGVLLSFAARAEEDNVLRRPMITLCHELQTEASMMRRFLGYLEDVGAIARTTRAGRGAVQEIELLIDVAPAAIYHAMQARPFHPASQVRAANSGSAARVREAKTSAALHALPETHAANYGSTARNSPETRAANYGSSARVSETHAANYGSSARVELETPVNPLTSTPSTEVINNTPLKQSGGDVNRGGVGGEPSPPPKRRAVALLSDAQTTELVGRFLGQFDSEQDVLERLAGAMLQPRAKNGPYEYAVAWLKKDAVDLAAARSRIRPGTPQGNGHAKRQSVPSPFARAEQLSKQPGGYTLGSVGEPASADPR